jgi:hypothetical protein
MRAAVVLALLAAAAAAVAIPAARAPSNSLLLGRALAPQGGTAAVVAPARAAAATDQVDVSHARNPQAEVAVAVDPSNSGVLLAGSNSFSPAMQVYSSTDGGASWTSEPLPRPESLCSYGDPAVAIDAGGRQYYASLAGECSGSSTPRVVPALATRPDASAAWTTHALQIRGATVFNDKEAIAVDVSAASPHLGRLYLTWARLIVASNTLEIALSHSDDGGTTWSPAIKVSPAHATSETYPSVGVGADGSVYAAWLTIDQRVLVARSTDGGDHFGDPAGVVTGGRMPFGLCHFGSAAIPAQPKRCIAAAPLVSVDRTSGRVYVTYSAATRSRGPQDVFVSAYDGALAPLFMGRRVNAPDGAVASDQFFPAAAVDQGDGRLWACWYDTTGDRTRKRTRYTCSASRDGGATWAAPVPAATVYSNETGRAATAFEYGDYAGLAVADGIGHPVWTDSRNLATLGEEIYTTALQLP